MLNEVNLIGNVASDPQLRQVGSSSVASFRLATSSMYQDKSGEKQKKTEFHNITVWGKMADVIMRYVTKGKLLYIKGEIRYTEKDGKYYTQINSTNFQFLSSPKSDSKAESSNDDFSAGDEQGDDLPF